MDRKSITGLYVHYPLCSARCGYCDFAIVVADKFPHQKYADLVCREIRARRVSYQPAQLTTIYFGGGTPSLWPTQYIQQIIQTAREVFNITNESLEITLEANPEGLSLATLTQLKAAGVNRISLGVQSLDNNVLQRLTRKHAAESIKPLLEQTRKIGFRSVNVDLIFGVPNQTVAQLETEIEAYLQLEPSHISTYQLTLAKGQPLWRQGARPASSDLLAEMMELSRYKLEQNGFNHYEVSNYARPGYEAMHNISTWRGNSYLGVGAAAHSLIHDGPQNIRIKNPPFQRYLDAEVTTSAQSILHVDGARIFKIDCKTAQFEMALLGLRTRHGISRADFRERFNVDPWIQYEKALIPFVEQSWLEVSAERIAPTAKGIWFADEISLALA